MNLRKFISGVSALTIAASAFAGLAVTANASVEVDYSRYTESRNTTFDWSTIVAADTDAGTEAVTSSEDSSVIFGASSILTNQGWYWWTNDSSKTTKLENSVLSAYTQNAKGYVRHIADTAANAAGKVYKYTFTFKTSATGRNSNAIGANKGDYQASNWNYTYSTATKSESDLGITTANTDYAITAIFDNVKHQAVYTVGTGDPVYFDISDTMTGLYFRPGKGETMSISNVSFCELSTPTVTKMITTAPYAKLQPAGGSAVYSDYLGNVSVTEDEGSNVSYTISKGGYANRVVQVDFSNNNDVSAPLTPTENGVLFYEDFQFAGGGAYGTNTWNDNNSGYTRTQGTTTDQNLQYIGGGKGNRTLHAYPVYDAGSYDVYTLTYDVEDFSENKDESGDRTTTVTIKDANNKTCSTVTLSALCYYAEGDTSKTTPITNLISMTVNGEAIANPVATGTVTVVIDTKKGTATTTVSDKTSTIEVANAAAPTDINIDLSRNQRYTIDNIKVTGVNLPSATAALTSVTNVQPFKMGSDGEEKAVTAAILNITVANQSTAIDVTYDNKTKTSGTKVVGSVRLGVIVPGIVEDLGTSSFTVTAHVE